MTTEVTETPTAADGPMAVGATAGRRRPTKALVPRSDLPNGPDHGLLAHIVVQDVRPSAPHGYPAKAVVGELIPVVAAIFKDGHDVLAAQAVLRKGTDVVATSALVHLGNDVWSGAVTATEMGGHELIVEAWTDRYATWAHKATVKLAAHQDVEVELAEAQDLLSEWAPGAGAGTGAETSADSPIAHALVALSDEGAHDADRINPALSAAVAHALAGPRLARDLTTAGPVPIWVDRPRAAAGAWYELFPRSFGGLRGAAAQIPRLAQLGFDVLYIPPVHPIGHSFRKGKNNTLTAGPGDPGSPWAIGSEDGGHLAIDPGLGTFEDFDNLVRTATDHGMEVALDIAFQCSPDHPWVKEHPEWFHHRPDGSIAYAENPPKKYQDIYPLNFWPFDEGDRLALWQACEKIFVFWAERGIRIFRVDNPHTKPFAFWEWVLAAVRSEWPDAVFLAEAFTRPKVMARLAEVGFSQSYTYFTWRLGQYGPEGLRAYVEELAHGPLADYMRPNFWPNTPDILSGPLRGGPPSAFALRYVLAATLAPSYGVYSGYELFENEPASPDNEEYLNSEKYEIKHRDLSRPGSLSPLFAAINESRKRHPAFASLRSVRFHGSDNPSIMAYSKRSDDGDDIVLVVVTLDPYAIQESVLHIDLDALGLAPDCLMDVKDELSGETYTWGAHPYVRLDPYLRVAHVFAVNAQARGRA